MTKAHEAAAAARNNDYENAAALYYAAALEADLNLDETKSRKHYKKAAHFERIANSRK